jgi:hypothetical protein
VKFVRGVVVAWYWNPRMWSFSYHGGCDSCCRFWMEFGPLEIGLGH